jgi:hypothetical protein
MKLLSRHTSLALGLSLASLALPASAAAGDRDHDRIPDRWEKRHKLKVTSDDAAKDRDRDGLTNWGEYRAGTHPGKRDSDGDGRRDGREDADRDKLANAQEELFGYDPGDRDSDDDGIRDGKERGGVVTAYDGERITIRLVKGGVLKAALGPDLAGDCGEDEEDQLDDDCAPVITVGTRVHEAVVKYGKGGPIVIELELVE